MPFQVPIQQRDTVDLQNTPQVQDTSADRITPINTEGVTKPLESVADMYRKQAKDLETKTEQFATTKFENDANASVNDNLSKVLAAQGENSFVVADQAKAKLRHDLDQSLQQMPEQYRQKFTGIANKSIDTFDKTSMGHQYAEQNKVADTVEKQNANDLSDKATLAVYEPQKYADTIQELKDKISKTTRRKNGWRSKYGSGTVL